MALRFLEPLVDRFVPSTLDNSIEQLYRSRILVMVSLSAAVILIPFCIARYVYQGIHPYPVILTAIVLLCITTPKILSISKSIEYTGVYFTLPGSVGFAALCFVDGGLQSPTLFALPIVPLFGIFFSGFGLGLVLLTIICIALGILILFPDSALISAVPLSPTVRDYFFAASTVSASLVLISMAYFFVQWQQLVRQGLLTANRSKNEFLSGMSHEIRTPLNSIMGFADVLSQGYSGELNTQQKKYVEHILNGSEHLSSLIDDFLDISNIEENRIDLSIEQIKLNPFLEECVASVRRNDTPSVMLDLDCSPDVLLADKTRFRQIILNLLNNAMKFTPKQGQVSLCVENNFQSTDFIIQDTGPGVPLEYREKIFTKFYQVSSTLSSKTKGSGLGLFISKRLAEMHGGKLLLDAEYKDGARFVLSLPKTDTPA